MLSISLNSQDDIMSTKAQIEANRRNAEKSTGPKTDEGKKNSCLNAITHGFCSSIILLPNESEEIFSKTVENVFRYLRPENEIEYELFERIVSAIWRLKRLGFIETQLFESFMKSSQYSFKYQFPYANAFLSMCKEDLPNKLSRYEHAIEASLYRALSKFADLRSNNLDYS